MRARDLTFTASIMITSLLGCGGANVGAPVAGAPATTSAGPRPTEPFRREHVSIKEHLAHLNAAVGKLRVGSTPAEQRDAMKLVVEFLRGHIKPHAEWEERVLYPAVDKRAASGGEPFTASMRYEHRIVGRWIDELAAEAGKPTPDATAFARRADNLLGLIAAHFEEEEEVLLPILDRTMSQAEFDREVGSGGH